MSLFGTMKTAVSGMNAQANRLGTVGDNIANANTTGYKSASTSFSTLVLSSNSGSYNSGGVNTKVNYAISQQGSMQSTTSKTDFAIEGDGFFVVQDTAGNIFMTRSGSFTPDQEGFLVNDSGFKLLGYEYEDGAVPTTVINSFAGLVPVRVSSDGLTANPSTTGSLSGNLNDAATIVPAGNLPSQNPPPPAVVDIDQNSTLKTSVTGYDPLGNPITYDFYFSKTDNAPTWEVSVYNAADAAKPGPFPYTGSGAARLAYGVMEFDAGNLKSINGAGTSLLIDDTLKNQVKINVDLSSMTQLGAKSSISKGGVNGNAAEPIQSVSMAADGLLSATYAKSPSRPLYRVPLADVASPDNLAVLSGNVYQTSADSGVVTLGFAGSNGFGKIASSQLESSNVDIANELTEMIQSQRSYTANSKVFQTGSDLMDVLINLVR